MDWVITLRRRGSVPASSALIPLLDFSIRDNGVTSFFLFDLDASGVIGNAWSEEVEVCQFKNIPEDRLRDMLTEDGQIIEMVLLVSGSRNFVIKVSDGSLVDLMGYGRKPTSAEIGEYEDVDVAKWGQYIEDMVEEVNGRRK